jgi:hypothetical protein
VLISVQFCGKCGFKHADSSLRTAFCTQCGTARFITDLRINREQLVSAAISKIVDAPDQAQMIDAAPANSHRSVTSAGDPVDVYPECTPFTVALEAKWLWTNVLQRDESAKDRVCFRDKSHEHLIRQLAAQLHPQLALACQDSWISSPTAAGLRFLPQLLPTIALVSGGQTWTKKFYCQARNCPTTMEMKCLVPRADDDAVNVTCKFPVPGCVHLVGDLYGQLRGIARREWGSKHMRPHALQLAAAQAMPRERAVTGNMQGYPTESSAQRLSSQQQVLLRRKKDLLPSLQDLCRTDNTSARLSSLSLKPASVLLLSESMHLIVACLSVVIRFCSYLERAVHRRTRRVYRLDRWHCARFRSVVQ